MTHTEQKFVEAADRLWEAWCQYGPLGSDGSRQGDAIQKAFHELRRICRQVKRVEEVRISQFNLYDRSGGDE